MKAYSRKEISQITGLSMAMLKLFTAKSKNKSLRYFITPAYPNALPSRHGPGSDLFSEEQLQQFVAYVNLREYYKREVMKIFETKK